MSNTTWFEVDGDNTLALDWKIDEHSIVWEIGGFEGRWAAQIQEKYNPNNEPLPLSANSTQAVPL